MCVEAGIHDMPSPFVRSAWYVALRPCSDHAGATGDQGAGCPRALLTKTKVWKGEWRCIGCAFPRVARYVNSLIATPLPSPTAPQQFPFICG